MPVWTLVIRNHLEGENHVTAYIDEEKVHKFLFDWVCEHWDYEEMEHDPFYLEPVDAVGYFFNCMGDSYDYSLNCIQVQGQIDVEETEEPEEVFLTEEELRMASIGLQHVDIDKMAQEIGESPRDIEDKVIEIAKKLG